MFDTPKSKNSSIHKERGAVAGEYAVLLAMVSIALSIAVGALLLAINGRFQAVATLIN